MCWRVRSRASKRKIALNARVRGTLNTIVGGCTINSFSSSIDAKRSYQPIRGDRQVNSITYASNLGILGNLSISQVRVEPTKSGDLGPLRLPLQWAP